MEVETNEEELLRQHKLEKKNLQSQIQSLKKTVTKGDKKKKKEVMEEITRLEEELESRQLSELQGINPVSHEVIGDAEDTNVEIKETRASRRRTKKAQEEREREERIGKQAEKNRTGPRHTEMNAMKTALEELGLQLHNIPADGNCLYCAINHQLESTERTAYSVPDLRKLTADFMRDHKEDFLPFMYSDSDDVVSEEYFESYCKEVASTKLWGGQLELKALSNALQCPIKIIQANGPPTLQGENFQGPELVLAYHRHLYKLGEHYNSTIKPVIEKEDDLEQ